MPEGCIVVVVHCLQGHKLFSRKSKEGFLSWTACEVQSQMTLVALEILKVF